MDQHSLPTDEEVAEVMEMLEHMQPLLRQDAEADARAQSERPRPPLDTCFTIDESGRAIAGPSSQGHRVDDAAADRNTQEAPDDGEPADWNTRGLLNTVKKGDDDEIRRLRSLVNTRLHRAVLAENLEALWELVVAGAAPSALDWEGRTPLHLCVQHRLMGPLMVLLSVPGSADVPDASGWPLLHAALLHDWLDGARAILDAGARVDTSGPRKIEMLDLSPDYCKDHRYPSVDEYKFIESLPRTAIEVAIMFDMAMLEAILSVARKNGVVDCLNIFGHTALHTAVWLNKPMAVEALLRSGASPQRISLKNDSVLHTTISNLDMMNYFLENTDVKSSLNDAGYAPEHIAILRGHSNSLVLLLDKLKNTRVKTGDEEKNTPLHLAAIKGDEIAKIILERDAGLEQAAELALALREEQDEAERELEELIAAERVSAEQNPAEVDLDERVDIMFEVNAHGETPLHLAAKHNNKELTALFLLNGANLSTQTKDGTTVFKLISTKFYKSESFFENIFDGFIYNDNIFGKTFVHLDYDVLANGEGMSQIKVLEEFVRCDQSKLLIHPLIESLLYLKWKHFQKLFYTLISIYAIFLGSFNVLMIDVFYWEYNSHNSTNTSSSADAEAGYGGWYWLLIVLTYFTILLLLLQESMFIYLKRWSYFASLETCVKLSALALCAATPPLAALVSGPWPRHIACVALLLAWLQALFLFSRFPGWGYYVLMLGKVALNILKILVIAMSLVIAFAFCFMIQYRGAPPFDGPVNAIVKTLAMMSSEFEYENLFKQTAIQFLFVIFVIFVAIVVMNFMTGVAVSDINDLNETGKIRRAEKQVELLSTFEALAYDGGLAKWFIKVFGDKRYHSYMYTERGHKSTWDVSVRKYSYTRFASDDSQSYNIQIRSSKLFNAIIETPSKQQQADIEAVKNNTEKPYRSQNNATNNMKELLPRGTYQRSLDDDFILRKREFLLSKQHLGRWASASKMSYDFEVLKRRYENLNTQINLSGVSNDILRSMRLEFFDPIKEHLAKSASDSSKMLHDIEGLKRCNENLNMQISQLSGVSNDILSSMKRGCDWTALARTTRRRRRCAARKSGQRLN